MTVSIDPFPGNGSIIISFNLTPVAPQITSAASDSVPTASKTVAYQVTSSGYPAATYALSGAPSWLSIDPNSGALSGTWPAGTLGVRDTFEHAFVAEQLEPVGEDVGRDAELVLEVLEALDAQNRVAEDQEGPAFTNDF